MLNLFQHPTGHSAILVAAMAIYFSYRKANYFFYTNKYDYVVFTSYFLFFCLSFNALQFIHHKRN